MFVKDYDWRVNSVASQTFDDKSPARERGSFI